MKSAETSCSVIEGPDLNVSRSPLDSKVYRQILLPNGLRAILISDTVAMQQELFFCDDDDDDDDDEEEKEEEEEEEEEKPIRKRKEKEMEKDDDDDNEEEDDEDEEDDGLRDAAAAMVVGVGSMYDPPQAQGLAHFLEHMLFMGTKKYPEENAYESFLSKNGGSDNAFTELEYTLYHLSIQQEKLFPALDMFAQFFIHPLMLRGSVERELNSIESEFQLNKNSDSCRLEQLIMHTSGHTPEQHPFAKFPWGNLLSLKEIPEKNNVDTMKLLRDFYNQYYFATNMSLVVVGAYSLDQLQEQVIKSFSDIPSNPREKAPWLLEYINPNSWDRVFKSPMASLSFPFQKSSLKKVYKIPPVRERHTLSIAWQIPNQAKHWGTRPCDYISHLLGHEAQGSLLASLKAKSWATMCFVGVESEGYGYASSHALFISSFSLSELGVEHWEQVVEETFKYIGLLRHYCSSNRLPKWIYEELRLTAEVSYRYGNEESPEDLVETIAERMAPHFMLPPDRFLDGQDLLFGYDNATVSDLLDNYLTPENCRIDILSSTFGRASEFDAPATTKNEETLENGDSDKNNKTPPPMVENKFGTRYWCDEIPESTIQAWINAAKPEAPTPDSVLNLPQRNPFVPEDLQLKPLPSDDADHPLLNASLKLCITVGKRKSWFPATVTKYNSTKNSLVLSYEDEGEKTHKLDHKVSELTPSVLKPGFEGWLDNKRVKFRLISLAKEGEGAVMKFGDETDYMVEEGSSFPAIPPPLSESRLPKILYNSNGIKLWHLQDRKFKRPIAELRLRLICGSANKSPLLQACSDLFVILLSDVLTETTYMASMAELQCSIGNSEVGLFMRVNGFNDKLMNLFCVVFKSILSFRSRSESDGLPDTVPEGRFEAALEVLKRRYANAGMKASSLSTDIRLRCLRESSWSSHAKLKALDDISKEHFVAIISQLLDKVAVETLYHGNVNVNDAHVVRDVLLQLLKETGGTGLTKKKYPTELVAKFPVSSSPEIIIVPTIDPAEPNNSVEYYFQVGKDNIDDRVMSDLLAQMMYEPLYDQLRTKDQFGYTVSCDSRWTNGVIGFYFYVVSASKSASEITKRIERFIVEYRKSLENISKEDFMEQLVGLAKNKLERFDSLAAECSSYWGEIRDGKYEWEVKRNEALALRSATKQKALDWFDKWISVENPRRSIVVQVIGTTADEGRPKVDQNFVHDNIEDAISQFHKKIGHNTWGKINYHTE